MNNDTTLIAEAATSEAESNVIWLNSQVPVPSNGLIADEKIRSMWQDLKNAKLTLKAQQDAIKAIEDKFKQIMGNNEFLYSPTGEELITWKQAGPRIVLDEKALKMNFADVYAVCCEEKPGNRTFLVK